MSGNNQRGRPRVEIDLEAVERAVEESVSVATLTDQLLMREKQLEACARQRAKAEAYNSFTALRGLAQDERRLQDEIAQLREQRREEALASDDAAVAELVRVVDSLPAELQETIRERLNGKSRMVH